MAREKGQPSGSNKPEPGTGVPTNVNTDNLRNDEEMTEKYTDDDERVAGHLRELHPNRNTDKNDATNMGGYKQ